MPADLKQAVFDAVIALAGEFDDLRSFLPVGSHADRAKPEELHNDYDFLYVFETSHGRATACCARASTPSPPTSPPLTTSSMSMIGSVPSSRRGPRPR